MVRHIAISAFRCSVTRCAEGLACAESEKAEHISYDFIFTEKVDRKRQHQQWLKLKKCLLTQTTNTDHLRIKLYLLEHAIISTAWVDEHDHCILSSLNRPHLNQSASTVNYHFQYDMQQ